MRTARGPALLSARLMAFFAFLALFSPPYPLALHSAPLEISSHPLSLGNPRMLQTVLEALPPAVSWVSHPSPTRGLLGHFRQHVLLWPRLLGPQVALTSSFTCQLSAPHPRWSQTPQGSAIPPEAKMALGLSSMRSSSLWSSVRPGFFLPSVL